MTFGNKGSRRSRSAAALSAACSVFALAAVGRATITIQQHSNTNWTIGNGDLNVTFDPASNNLTSVALAGTSNLLDPNNSQLYPEFAGTPFGAGTQTSGFQQTSNYIDFWTTTASTGTSVNPITYSFHYVMFNNDPNIMVYEVLNHSATDPATSVGQGQFIMRFNTSEFNQTYQENVGPNNPGPQTSTIPPTYPADGSPNANTVDAQAGRNVTNATYDLTGSGLAGDWGSNFNTKYDFATYYQYLQAETISGPQYSVSTIYTSMDTINGGPTHQDLTSTNLALLGFLSGHEGDANYAYVPPQGVASTRVFGPYDFQIVANNGDSQAQIYQNAVSSMPAIQSEYNTDSELISNGYVPVQSRGSISISAAASGGWSSNSNNNMVILSDPDKDYQESVNGDQYWSQVSAGGTASISNIAPGNYELTMYQLGQWGETVVQGVHVLGGKVSIPQNLTYTPQNFSTSAPIWTIGTPDRSDAEFLNGSNVNVTFANDNATATAVTNNGVVPGGDLRQYYGNYNYWYEEQQLGTPGYVAYNATAVTINGKAEPATNNPLDWIGNQWETFDPGVYDPANNTTNGYSAGYGPNGGQPAYVTAAGGAGTYKGSAWLVNFSTTSAQVAQGKFVDLSVGLAANEASLIATLNGHQEIWHFGGNNSDPMVRSGDSGTYEFLVFEFPTSDLTASGGLDQLSLSVSQPEGVMYDALRMEISATGANPSTTGWNDYYYITGANTQSSPNWSAGLIGINTFSAQADTWSAAGGGTWGASVNWLNSSIPGVSGEAANFTGSIVAASTVNVESNWTVGTVYFNSANSYTLAAAGGTLTMNNSASSAAIIDDAGTHSIAAPISLVSNLIVSVTNAGDGLNISGSISGSGGVSVNGSGTVTLAGVNTYGGPTAVNSGLLVIGAAGALPSGGGMTVGTASSVGMLQLTPGVGVANLSSLAVNAGSTMDIANNAVMISYGSPSNDPLATILTAIVAGRNGGAWTGTGITSSTAAGEAGHFAIGYVDGNVDGGGAAGANQLLIEYTLAGDANLAGSVGIADLLVVAQNFGMTGADWAHGNFTYDPAGGVGIADLLAVAQNFGQSIALAGESGKLSVSPAWQVAAAVPEPIGLGFIGFAAVILGRRRQK